MKPLDVKNLDAMAKAGRAGFFSRFKDSRVWRGVVQAILAVGVLAAGLAVYQYLLANREPIFRRPVREQVWAVNTVPVAFSDHKPVLRLYGETVAGRTVDLRVLVTGEVVSIGENFRDGGIVKAGETLVQIDPFAYRGALTEARANLREAEARLKETEAHAVLEKDALARAGEQLALARRDLDRAAALSTRGTLSDKAVDDRKLLVSQREQAVEQRRNTLVAEQAKADQQRAVIARLQWRLEEAERNLSNTVLKAPFDAYVRNVNAQIGRLMGANDLAATLLDRNLVEVKLALTDRQFGRIIEEGGAIAGRPVEVIWNLGPSTRSYDGRIDRVAAEINTESGGVDVFARVDTRNSPLPLRPGAFVEVRLADRTYENTVRLPETALYEGDSVYIVEFGRLARRPVKLLGTDGDDILVTGELKPGDKVITTRISEIGEGLVVEEVE